MKKIKLSSLLKTDILLPSDTLLLANSQKLINSSDVINKEFPNLCPELSAFTLNSGWSLVNGVLTGRSLMKWVSAESPEFNVVIGRMYTMTIIYDRVDMLARIQPIGGDKLTATTTGKGLFSYPFIATASKVKIRVHSNTDTPGNNIDVSYIKVEEGMVATGIVPLVAKKVFS